MHRFRTPSKSKWLKLIVLDKWTQQGSKCYYCDRGMKAGDVTADHVKPKCYGGTDEPDNIVASCYPCNRAKGNMPVTKFRKVLRSKVRSDKFWMARAQFRYQFYKQVESACKRIRKVK